jgi:fibronectin type 3 domain-containing protein
MPWTGAPSTPIAVKSDRTAAGSTVWMSWNGDTRVDHWRVLAGTADGQLEFVANVPRTGFESTVDLDQAYARYRVVGISAEGKVLGRSKVNRLGQLTR